MSNRKYPVETNGWQILLKDMRISGQDILRSAGLPLDLLSRKSPMITGQEYLRLWEALASLMRNNPLFPLEFATMTTPETFSPPIFASFSSPNLTVAANRISHYKPLVGPVRITSKKDDDQLTVSVGTLSELGDLPASLVVAELVWWVHMPRLATREKLIPLSVHTRLDIPEKSAYEDYFGVRITKSKFDGVVFSRRDSERPFLTANDAMWEIFEPELNQRIQDLTQNATYSEKVRACLIEILASGQYNVDDVASRLAVSRRTLQRNLRNENTTFQQILDNLREELARHYLLKSDYTSGQIAFLLGYEEPNSFFRAFRAWTGQTPDVIRSNINRYTQ